MVRWWETLHDAELDRLITSAIACNPDIEIALTRVQAARTQQIVIINNALPKVEASAGIATGTGSDLTRSRAADALRSGDNTAGLAQITSLAGFDTGWELDLFGRYRRQFEAVRDDAEAIAEFRHAVIISVIADVARNYVVIRGLQLRLQIVGKNITAAQKLVDVVQSRFESGITNELDVTLAKRELASVKAQVPAFVAAVALAESQLAVLLGTFSPCIVPELGTVPRLPNVPSRVRPGVPADLLRRRPDIRVAERQLAAATARIGVAISDLFPTAAFTAGIGFQGGSREANTTTKPVSQPVWSAGPGGYWPLLDFGKIDALIDVQELAAHEQLVTYKKVILYAVEEVDAAIKQYRAQQGRQRKLAVALEESRRAVRLSIERYERGLTDFLYVLDAERQEYALEDQYAVARETVVIQYIALFKALGGGWELCEELPPLKPVQPAVAAMIRRLTNDWQ
jgi:NodT family efflux transporter outer membrane factor (OMF) lipoprotein